MRQILLILIVAAVAGSAGWYLGQHGSLDDLPPFDLGSLLKTSNSSSSTPPPKSGDTIRIATFNIQVFGTSKLSKTHVVDMLARIVRQFDIVAIQEVRCKDESLVPQFVELVNQTGRHFDYAIGPRLGRTVSKEQYAFLFDTASIQIDRTKLYTVHDPYDRLHREPFVGWFRTRGTSPEQAFTFSLVNIHTDPDEVEGELNALDDVYRVVRDDGRHEDDVILLGDFNVDDRHLGQLGSVPGVSCTVSGVPTNTRGTAQYDNIVFHKQATSEFTGRGGVFDFLRQYNLTVEQALEVSDHFPVWAEFSVHEGGTPGHVGSPGSRQ